MKYKERMAIRDFVHYARVHAFMTNLYLKRILDESDHKTRQEIDSSYLLFTEACDKLRAKLL